MHSLVTIFNLLKILWIYFLNVVLGWFPLSTSQPLTKDRV